MLQGETYNYPQKARKLPKRDFTKTILNQYHKLRNVKIKRLCMVKQKSRNTSNLRKEW